MLIKLVFIETKPKKYACINYALKYCHTFYQEWLYNT